jgi:TRAP-type C4-dicarboxylate transport system permease large subunit
MEEVVASCVPFFLLYLVALGIVTYVPGLYMWLPAHMQP